MTGCLPRFPSFTPQNSPAAPPPYPLLRQSSANGSPLLLIVSSYGGKWWCRTYFKQAKSKHMVSMCTLCTACLTISLEGLYVLERRYQCKTSVTVQWQKGVLNSEPFVTSDLDEKVLPLYQEGPPIHLESEWVFMEHQWHLASNNLKLKIETSNFWHIKSTRSCANSCKILPMASNNCGIYIRCLRIYQTNKKVIIYSVENLALLATGRWISEQDSGQYPVYY